MSSYETNLSRWPTRLRPRRAQNRTKLAWAPTTRKTSTRRSLQISYSKANKIICKELLQACSDDTIDKLRRLHPHGDLNFNRHNREYCREDPVFLSSRLLVCTSHFEAYVGMSDTSSAHGAHAPNALPTADNPSPDSNGEILKPLIKIPISYGPTLTDKIMHIHHLSRFRE